MKKLFLSVLFLVSMVYAGSDINTTAYDFNLTKDKKATAYVNWDTQHIAVEIGKKRIVLPDISEDFMDYKKFVSDISESLFFEDLNFDGYADIGVIVGVGYGGLNVFADYYFYDPKKAQFHKYFSNVSNLTIIGNTEVLHAPMKSGTGYFHDYYQIDKEGRAFLFLSASTSWPDEEEGNMLTDYSAHNVKVKVKKAYFYDGWDGKRLKSYLIQGDKISKVLDMVSSEGHTWIKVLYRGKKRDFRYWVKMNDLVFEEIIVREE
ncbi:hypothetical protein YH65_08195 [Sulfurovum lithotrophicum]|uniref:SH3b domain-containing protein n=1 Tax=Sulfurovum lithotrophicum TaxID=206403 RepID=A0A7U4M280_9BACT|nr:hypothetical protein [Sulfurovum lithotrophicum]AKF25369.1 hypothetical protein YH65_08195 [Sulfurovum lithotrophicum]